MRGRGCLKKGYSSDSEKINSFGETESKEILEIFLKDGDEILAKIKRQKEEGDIKNLSLAVHSIKGLSSNIGADKLYKYIKEIEPNLKNGKFPEDAEWIKKFEDLYAELKKEIRRVLK